LVLGKAAPRNRGRAIPSAGSKLDAVGFMVSARTFPVHMFLVQPLRTASLVQCPTPDFGTLAPWQAEHSVGVGR
jgi:hypothetical protein